MRLSTPDYVKILARHNRQNPTEPEKLLWGKLRNNQLGGYKFYRQCPIGRYVADFYCGQVNLAIEVDGGIHREYEQAEYDKVRQKEIEGRNIKVLRFPNEQVIHHMDDVLNAIHIELIARDKNK